MSNQAHLLPTDVRCAAAAIANARAARRGAPAVANILDVLPASLFTDVVEDACAALAAGRAVAPPVPRARGPLNGLDAAALGNDLGAGSLLILARDRNGVARAALWAVSADTATFPHAEAHALWSAVAGVLRGLPDSSTPDSPTPEEPSPEAEQRP